MASIYLMSAEIENRLVVTIPKQDSDILKIPALNLKVGESGIITREIDNNEFILGNAIVTSIDDGVASLAVTPFKTLKEKYMPTPLGKPKEKDKIIFRILYDRAVIIAPNQNRYQDILDNNKSLDFIHPDIFASYLATNDSNMPSISDFRGFCDKFNIGLVFISQENEVDILDCQSFKVIAKDSITLQDNTQKRPFSTRHYWTEWKQYHQYNTQKRPFFTRLSDDNLKELFSLDELQEYFNYYSNIIK